VNCTTEGVQAGRLIDVVIQHLVEVHVLVVSEVVIRLPDRAVVYPAVGHWDLVVLRPWGTAISGIDLIAKLTEQDKKLIEANGRQFNGVSFDLGHSVVRLSADLCFPRSLP